MAWHGRDRGGTSEMKSIRHFHGWVRGYLALLLPEVVFFLWIPGTSDGVLMQSSAFQAKRVAKAQGKHEVDEKEVKVKSFDHTTFSPGMQASKLIRKSVTKFLRMRLRLRVPYCPPFSIPEL